MGWVTERKGERELNTSLHPLLPGCRRHATSNLRLLPQCLAHHG